MTKQDIILSIKRKDGKIFKVGDKFHYGDKNTVWIVKGRKSTRKMRIAGFEKHDKGWYVLYFPQYANGKIEKVKPWRACDLKDAVIIQ